MFPRYATSSDLPTEHVISYCKGVGVGVLIVHFLIGHGRDNTGKVRPGQGYFASYVGRLVRHQHVEDVLEVEAHRTDLHFHEGLPIFHELRSGGWEVML